MAGENFKIKDSGKRESFSSGMVRDTEDGKVDFLRVLEGPMFKRWAEHLTKGAKKYKDVEVGRANWTLAAGQEEYVRFRKSLFRHVILYLLGEEDEDHAAAVMFNINGAEFVKEKMNGPIPERDAASNGGIDRRLPKGIIIEGGPEWSYNRESGQAAAGVQEVSKAEPHTASPSNHRDAEAITRKILTILNSF